MRPGLALALAITAAQPAAAHFLEIIPSADVLPDGGPVTLDLTFTHPMEGGPAMEMAAPARVGVLTEGATTDLAAALTERKVDGAAA